MIASRRLARTNPSRRGRSTVSCARPSTTILTTIQTTRNGRTSGGRSQRSWASTSAMRLSRRSTLTSLPSKPVSDASSQARNAHTRRWKPMTIRQARLTSRQPATTQPSGLTMASRRCTPCTSIPAISNASTPPSRRTTCGSISLSSRQSGG